jgi:Ni,Fe-hydrogenase III large subunit
MYLVLGMYMIEKTLFNTINFTCYKFDILNVLEDFEDCADILTGNRILIFFEKKFSKKGWKPVN